MLRKIDLENWNRAEHFRFFSGFEEPFYGIVTDVDCTHTYQRAKEMNTSFFALTLYEALKAANQIEEFRYRVIGDEQVVVFDKIHASPTIGREDHTFGFAFVEYCDDIETFFSQLNKESVEVRKSEGIRLTDFTMRQDVIHFSSIPWISFTGLSHARSFRFKDSVPKISFGKIKKQRGSLLLPVSIHVHHGLVDGFHIAQFLEQFQQFLD